VGIGTDGSASNNDVDMFGEMNTVAKIHKVARMDPDGDERRRHLACRHHGRGQGSGCRPSWKSAVWSRARRPTALCSILNQPHLTPIYHPVSHLVYAARGSDVIHSVINGRVVMRDRRLLTLDEILARAAEIGAGFRQDPQWRLTGLDTPCYYHLCL
jgi:5-methylthioadenosine/S-adenosylhomocysteine deaminase